MTNIFPIYNHKFTQKQRWRHVNIDKKYICHYYLVLLGINSHCEVLLVLNLELFYPINCTLYIDRKRPMNCFDISHIINDNTSEMFAT